MIFTKKYLFPTFFPSRNSIWLFLLPAIIVLYSGCDAINKLKGTIDDHANQVETILTNAEDALQANAENWESILRNALADLPNDQERVKQDLQLLIQRGIAHVGIELRCNISFMGDMLTQGLRRIKASFLGQTPPPVQAFICDMSPEAVDMNRPPNTRNSAIVTGYNLDVSNVKMFHVANSGSRSDVTRFLSVTSPFKLVINLGSNGLVLNNNSGKIQIDIGKGEIREIPIIQKLPEICKESDRSFNVSNIKVIPTKTRGDREYNDHGPCIRSNAEIFTSHNGTRLNARIWVKAWECPNDMGRINGDKSTAERTITRQLNISLPSGYRIERILSPTRSTLSFIDQDHKINRVADSGLVREWIVIGDTGGDDIGETSVEVNFNPIRVKIKETGGCLSSSQLRAMKKDAQLSPALEKQIMNFQPSILLTDSIQINH